MKVIKLYLSYFFTLTNILIFSLLILFIGFSYFMNIYDINSSLSYEEVISSYFMNSIFFTKIISIFSTIFIFIKASSSRSTYVINFVVTAGYKKQDNYYYLMIANTVITIMFISILFIIYLIIGFLVKNYFYIKTCFLESYLNLILVSLYYGEIAYLLMILINSSFVFLIPILENMISELIYNNNSVLANAFGFIFPSINEMGKLKFNFIYLVILIITLFFINKEIYISKDLKN